MLILARIIVYFGDFLSTALFIRAIMSWFVRGSGSGILNKIYGFLYGLTEPIVAPCRSFMDKHFNTGMFDFSIFVAMILVSLVTRLAVRLLLLFV
ncbi:MAG: YggT family protein [Firmicutes bacterium]|nr:YggT family protein [Bacillota bacterium]